MVNVRRGAFAFGLNYGHVVASDDERRSYRILSVSVRRSYYQRRSHEHVLTPAQIRAKMNTCRKSAVFWCTGLLQNALVILGVRTLGCRTGAARDVAAHFAVTAVKGGGKTVVTQFEMGYQRIG